MKPKTEPFLFCAAFFFLCGIASGEFAFEFGSTSLQPNMANQEIQLFTRFIAGTSSLTDVGGLQLNVRIGDGTGVAGSAPVFQGANSVNSQLGVSFAGAIWDGASTDVIGQAPIDNFPQYASIGISFSNNADFRTLTSSPQLIARLFIDTTNVFTGNVAITLNDLDLGQTYFQSTSDGSLFSETIALSGTNFTITAVPEPSSFFFGSLAFGTFLWHRRKHRRARQG